jgi:class II aldolase/adducin N-terminal domain-containing protein/carbohydrate kinase of FGGY family protein
VKLSNGDIYITPTSIEYDRISPDDIVVVGSDGAIRQGSRVLSSETPLHCLVDESCSEVMAIVRSDAVHAGLAGVCYAILDPLDKHSAFSSPRVRVTGGMAQKAERCQLLADVCEREVAVRPLEGISGLAGAALVAGCESSHMAAEVADQGLDASHASGSATTSTCTGPRKPRHATTD